MHGWFDAARAFYTAFKAFANKNFNRKYFFMTNKEFFIQTWQYEMKPTLSAINGLPVDMSKLSYSCHEKARTGTALLSHMLGHAESMDRAVDSFIAEETSTIHEFARKEDAAAYFEQHASSLAEKLARIDDATWEEKIIDYQHNGHSIFAYPMYNVFWGLLFDIIHHRGQLSTYYRPMGVRNPGIYGPTAEDMEEMMAMS